MVSMDPFRYFRIPGHGCGQPENLILLIDEIEAGVGWLPSVAVGPEGQEIRMCVLDLSHIGVVVFAPGGNLP